MATVELTFDEWHPAQWLLADKVTLLFQMGTFAVVVVAETKHILLEQAQDLLEATREVVRTSRRTILTTPHHWIWSGAPQIFERGLWPAEWHAHTGRTFAACG
jgi:hypothetical protein